MSNRSFKLSIALSVISILFALSPLAFAGADLEILSDAPSLVYLNDQYAGETPLTVFDIPANNYQLAVRRPGYQAYIRNFTVVNDANGLRPTLKFNATLEKQYNEIPQASNNPSTVIIIEKEYQNPVQLMISSNPRGASVYLDNNFIGYTPLNISGYPGQYKSIRLSRSGHRDHFEKIAFPYNNGGKMIVTMTRNGYSPKNTTAWENCQYNEPKQSNNGGGADDKTKLRNIMFGAAVINEAFTGNDKQKNRNRNSILGGMFLNEILNKSGK